MHCLVEVPQLFFQRFLLHYGLARWLPLTCTFLGGSAACLQAAATLQDLCGSHDDVGHVVHGFLL